MEKIVGRLSRSKGHAFEREVCRKLSAIGFPAKRRLTECREGNEGDAMFLAGDVLTVQAKVGKNPSPYKALAEAMEAASPGDYSVAIIRRNQRAGTKKLDMALMPLSEWLEWAEKLKAFGIL